MLRGFGMSLLLSWICLNSYAQLPHPNDTLDNGKKVSFNQFLGRFSVFNDFGGAAFYYSLNVGYSLVKTDLVTTDVTLGANRLQFGQYSWKDGVANSFSIPVGISTYVGRRKSRLNIRAGYSPRIFSELLSTRDISDCYNCEHVENRFFFSLGYTYQNPYGFFLGVNANLLLHVPSPELEFAQGTVGIQPWPGLVLGYRLPSQHRHREWRERGFKRRVLRLEDKEEKAEKKKLSSYDEIDAVFYTDETLEVDSMELKAVEDKLTKLKIRHERYLKVEQRLNGRSHVFAEAFGAAGFWSVNYSYTHPIAKSSTWMMDYRIGYGTDSEDMALPVHVGVKAMKNYRGSGIFIGAEPRYNWENGELGMVYFVEHNVEFHFAYGLTGGVAFYFFYDPERFLFQRDWAPYGGFFLGYRLPQIKKS